MHILGISAYYHDSAAVLIEDGKIIAAAQEEHSHIQIQKICWFLNINAHYQYHSPLRA